jgi:hypothetical protein
MLVIIASSEHYGFHPAAIGILFNYHVICENVIALLAQKLQARTMSSLKLFDT